MRIPQDSSCNSQLLHVFGHRILYVSKIFINAKLDCIISGNSWRWSSAVSHQNIEVKDNFPSGILPNWDEEGQAIWSFDSSGNFLIKSTLNLWRNKKPNVEWGIFNLVP